MSELEKISITLGKFNQSHVLQFWDELTEEQKTILCCDIKEVNVAEVCSYFQKAMETLNEDQSKLDDRMEPVPPELYGGVVRSSPDELKSYEAEGLQQISEGNVGVLLMAGGQGTRLGVLYPKGMYDVGLPSHKPLFQLQAERIRKLEDLAYDRTGKRSSITWYIMTSEATMDATEEFFKEHNFFGLNKNNIVMFEQGLLPCFTFDGRIIMDEKWKIARAPDGNGGIYRALRDKNILDDMENRGIKFLHAHAVDNILVKVADPVFVGYCVKKNAECGAKVVDKASPQEAVGVICKVDGQYQVVEYSEITSKTAEKCNSDGKLTFSAGNICNHFFTTEFLRKIADKVESNLQLHVAKKKIPYVDVNGQRHKPERPNGIKMEKFVFDVFPYADRFVIWEVKREEEFSPLKNADTAEKESPTTCRKDIFSLHRSYIQDAGGFVETNGMAVICEISPLVSYAGEGLDKLVSKKKFKSPVLLRSAQEETACSNGCTK
ncbi:UDP-N-acetylhexosamine pyrophosphorylase [Zootermopsis nevadensis]|uniref:UDP-N-acetylglucosamine diphosphorylase n=1 Tax=Zootermopsis nevadensis TaxID=136037 RepID=A0A067R5N0_ZOONE|nr:UDP-N-acetylhexosamine pyrophosphorylase [Zootermopsis nevadensis]KDR14652.1 UDP-N-acetylhexosamine pyrophosphorylase [Zootermopsis nevadensis]